MAMANQKRDHQNIAQKPRQHYTYSLPEGKEGSPQEPLPKVKGKEANQEGKEKIGSAGGVGPHIIYYLPAQTKEKGKIQLTVTMFFRLLSATMAQCCFLDRLGGVQLPQWNRYLCQYSLCSNQ